MKLRLMNKVIKILYSMAFSLWEYGIYETQINFVLQICAISLRYLILHMQIFQKSQRDNIVKSEIHLVLSILNAVFLLYGMDN